MKPLVDDLPASDESWRELAEHSITHDDLVTSADHPTDTDASNG